MNIIRNISIALMLGMAFLNTTTYAKSVADDELPGMATTLGNEGEGGQSKETEDSDKGGNNEESSKKTGSDSKSDSKKSIDLLSVIALIVGVGGVAFGGFCFMNLKTLQTTFDKLRERNKKNFKELSGRVEQLQQETAVYRQKLERNQSEISMLQSAQSSIKNVLQSLSSQSGGSVYSQAQASQRAHSSISESYQPAQESIKLYCGVPRGGVFANPSHTQTRQSLYQIIDNGGNTAKYAFIDDQNCAMVASRSTSDFLDPGCVISGPQDKGFSRVRTITPGSVRKSSNGWVIESKAVVELV